MAVINRVEDVLAAESVPKPKRRGVTFVNRGALQGIAEYRAFEFPAGTGRTWRVDTIDYLTGIRIAELELQMLEVNRVMRELKQREGPPDLGAIRALNERTAAFAEEAVKLAGPMMIPTGKRKWRLKLARRLGRNPLRGATVQEIASVIGFLAVCLTTSENRVGQVAAATN